jgi:hypothetical protein
VTTERDGRQLRRLLQRRRQPVRVGRRRGPHLRRRKHRAPGVNAMKHFLCCQSCSIPGNELKSFI